MTYTASTVSETAAAARLRPAAPMVRLGDFGLAKEKFRFVQGLVADADANGITGNPRDNQSAAASCA
jgi:hypothetical protein